jgi:hypothetical protein
MFAFFLFTVFEVIKEEFREEPLSSGEKVKVLENREVISAEPMQWHSPLVQQFGCSLRLPVPSAPRYMNILLFQRLRQCFRFLFNVSISYIY